MRTLDDINTLVRAIAGMFGAPEEHPGGSVDMHEGVKLMIAGFAAKRVQEERESCAAIADETVKQCSDYGDGHPALDVAQGIAAAIRARKSNEETTSSPTEKDRT